ncbi:MAG: hypothetical protein ACXWW8_03565 [Solirubrobacterales bacterium]
MVIALIGPGADPEDLAAVPGVAPGILSAGLSTVSPAQTYLDISQGNRIFTSLYPEDLPESFLITNRVPGWGAVVKRSEDAPGDLVPGLLAQTLEDAGVPVRVDPALRTPALLGANRAGAVDRSGRFDCIERRCPPGVTVIPAHLYELGALVRQLRGDDMLIALERPPPPGREGLALGIAGSGFDGPLTSDTTRTDGLVAATDLAPTILARFGLGHPEAMNGRPIRAVGAADASAVQKLGGRLSVVSSRRDPVIIGNALLWLAIALVSIAATRGRSARVALPLLALSCAYLPLLLLLGAALEPSRGAEHLIVGLGAPLLAAATLRQFRGYGALAVACGLTVGAYAIDVIAGSPLTKLSLIGPNPAIGVRFFGIGNELEAAIAVLVPVGVGAALAAWGPKRLDAAGRRTAVIAFLGSGALAAAIFAAGRFGADVGAAIVLPAGAAVAAAVAAGVSGRRRWLLLVLAAPLVAIAALAALDLVLGGGAHLTSSVLEAGGAGDLADVARRRLTLSAKSFARTADSPFLYLAAIGLVLGALRHERLKAWCAEAPAALAGFCGAVVATLVGTLANDSGAVVLMIGSAFVATCAGFAWAEAPARAGGEDAVKK